MAHEKKESTEQIDSVVAKVSALVSKMSGIQLGARQASMVRSRLGSRMVKLKLHRFEDYYRHLNANMDQESQALLSLLTTHHTFFFREFAHFEFLLNQGLPRLIERARERGDKKIRLWSAASSRGQEAYSLAMFMRFHLSALAPDVDFEIWGTDIDPESVKIAKNGVFKADELKQAPAMYVDGNWVRGKDEVKDFTKVKDHLKSRCHFQTANLLDCKSFLSGKSFDVIFCRNVYIYFDSEQIKQCSQTLMDHLDVDGLLFLGVSESLNGLGLSVQNTGPSVYSHTTRTVKGGQQRPRPVVAKPLEAIRRVLCVDDSPAILALLKKILVKGSGFEVVGTAKNGLEALEFLKSHEVDAITLDLHMPEMDGLGFLQAYSERKAPIMVVSAINRDDTSIAQKAVSLGAADYVEKPSLENLPQASNEICSKLKSVIALFDKAPANAKDGGVSKAKLELVNESGAKKKVLIVDDSPTIRNLLEKIINGDPSLEVVGKAELPSQVEDLIRKTKPDVITLDIHMPEMDGVTLLKKIYPKYRIPTVMISSISREEGPQVLQALESGAIDYIQKPDLSSLGQVAPQIRERLNIAARTKHREKSLVRKKAGKFVELHANSIVLMGASTGGTEALRVVLEGMPAKIPPILIVQHIPAGFSGAFARRLNELLPFEVKEAEDGDEILPNRVLIAPGSRQMGIQVFKDKLRVKVNSDLAVNRHQPSVDYLFQSAAKNQLRSSVAVLLTGMGADGARGMKELRDMGVRTIAQDKDSCVVFGMPREAIALNAAEFVRPLESIAESIVGLFSGRKAA